MGAALYRPSRWQGFREDVRYTGHWDQSEVGLIYFGARYYAPQIGRWISADPLNIHRLGGDANPYAFVGGSPMANVDPYGLDAAGTAAGVSATGAAVGTGSAVAAGVAEGSSVVAGVAGVTGPVGWAVAGVAGAVALGAYGVEEGWWSSAWNNGIEPAGQWVGQGVANAASGVAHFFVFGGGGGPHLAAVADRGQNSGSGDDYSGPEWRQGSPPSLWDRVQSGFRSSMPTPDDRILFAAQIPMMFLGVGEAEVALDAAPALARGVPATLELAMKIQGSTPLSAQTIALLETAQGPTLVGAGVADLTAEQIALAEQHGLKPTFLPGFHAEQTVINAAGELGLTPTTGVATNNICSGRCGALIQEIGGWFRGKTFGF